MKIALITDTHYGARNDNVAFLDHAKKFLDTVFFPYLQAHNITEIAHLGDIVDRRKYVNIYTAKRMRVDFLEPIVKSGRKMHVIPGNHDVYFKNSNSVNALEELVYGLDGIETHINPHEVVLGNTKVLFLPWICDENERECMDAVRLTSAPVLFAHLELKGFEMQIGNVCDAGLDASLFEKFRLVCSGHFHHKSTHRNINYLGNPFEMTWADFGDPKGFHVFDTDALNLTFVPNPHKLFRKIHYSDDGKAFEEVLNTDFLAYADSYVKVIVRNKTNPYLYDCFIQKLEEAGPLDVKAVEDHHHLGLQTDSEIIEKGEDTLDVLTKTVRQSGVAEEYQAALEKLMRELYHEASLLGV